MLLNGPKSSGDVPSMRRGNTLFYLVEIRVILKYFVQNVIESCSFSQDMEEDT